MQQLVSIIMPLFNASKYIAEAIDSVLLQTYKNWELIIVDDCSSDDSFVIAKLYADKDGRIKLFKQDRNSGAAKTRNKALDLARGRYISFLDADDLWVSKRLEIQVEMMQKKDLVLSYGGFHKISKNGEITGTFIPHPTTTYRQLLMFPGFNLGTVMYDADAIGKCYMEDAKISEDFTIWLDLLKKGYVAYGVLEPLMLYRTVAQSVSSNKLLAAKMRWIILRKREKLNLITSFIYFLNYAFCGFRKYLLR